jgi:hypothetical protein
VLNVPKTFDEAEASAKSKPVLAAQRYHALLIRSPSRFLFLDLPPLQTAILALSLILLHPNMTTLGIC